MSELQGRLNLVLERPDDLGARLSYASALDARHDPLGEFIRVECRLAQSTPDGGDTLGLQDRQFSLLEAHRTRWLAPLKGIAERAHFDRGLVRWIDLHLDAFLAHGAEIFGRFPIQALSLHGVRGRVGELLDCPWIDRVVSLTLRESRSYGDPGLADEDIATLAASDRPSHLRCIDLYGNDQLGSSSVEAILGAPWCDRLDSLGLGQTAAGDEGAALLSSTERLSSLRRLDLSCSGLGSIGARTLADSSNLARLGLTKLDFSLNETIDPDGYSRLIRSPVMARVRSVSLDSGVDAELVDAFLESEHLGSMRSLTLADSWSIDTISLRRLTRWPGLAGLEHLTFVLSGLNDEQLGILGRSPWLTDLKSLHLSETRVTDKGVERFCQSSACWKLEQLGIDRNRLTERSVRAILDAAWFPRLTQLDLHASGGLGDAGAEALATYRGPTRLRNLSLSGAGIGDSGALALAEASYTPQLWMLWLVGNGAITDATDAVLRQRLGDRVHTDVSVGPRPWQTQTVASA